MSYYEKLGWEMGKENEIFLKKGPEKLFFEILEKLNPKYVEAFKELLKYINKNSIVVFIPHFFPDGQNEEIQTYDELMEFAGKYDSVELIKIIEIDPRDKEKLLNFDEAIAESEIWLRSNNLKTASFDMKKIFDTGFDTGNYELEFFSNYNEFIGYEKEYYNYFVVDNEGRDGDIVEINNNNVFETTTYDPESHKTKKIPFHFFGQHPIVTFIIVELLKEENYLFKDFSKEMKQILNKGMNINLFFKYFKITGEINKLKEINSKKEYFVKFLKEQKWNKYRSKISFALNLLLHQTRFINENVPKFVNENVLRETVEKEDRIIRNLMNYEKIEEERFRSQFLFGIIFLLERIEINSEKIPEVITLMRDTFSMARELEIPVDLTKINSEKGLKKKHDKFSEEIKLRARLREKKKLETVFKFPEKFSPVIENLDVKYELIKDGKRLLEEGEEQRNCVFSYFKNITEGECLIYSLSTEAEENSEDSGKEKKRYTIEIIERNGKFEVVQFLEKFNKKTDTSIKLETELREKLKNIRMELKSS